MDEKFEIIIRIDDMPDDIDINEIDRLITGVLANALIVGNYYNPKTGDININLITRGHKSYGR